VHKNIGKNKNRIKAGMVKKESDIRSSSADAVTRQLRRDLLDGSIVPGSRILPKDLAERFDVSIVPVREAIRRLESEKLVVTSPQRATYAAGVGLEDIAGVYEVRRILEVELVCRAAQIATDQQRDACVLALKALQKTKPPSSEFFEAHRNFHWCLIRPATNSVAQNILDDLWQSVDRYLALAGSSSTTYFNKTYIVNFMTEHSDLLDSYLSTNIKNLKDLLTKHMDNNEESLRRACKILVPNTTSL